MKKMQLKNYFLKEDKDLEKVNQELGGFKSILNKKDEKHDSTKDSDFRGKINKELDSAKWGLQKEAEKPGFETTPEDPFSDSFNSVERFETKPEDAFSDAFNNKQEIEENFDNAVMHEAHCSESIGSGECDCQGVGYREPLDSLEHVSLTIIPDEEIEQKQTTSFAAPGGPNFDQAEYNSKYILSDDEIKKESTINENDPFNEFDPIGFDPDDDFDPKNTLNKLNDEGEEESGWLSYLLEPEENKDLSANDMKGKPELSYTQDSFDKNKSSSYRKETVERLKGKLLEEIKKLKK